MELTKAEKRNLGIKEIAKLVRESLKKEFPACKFSVTFERYSMGQSLNVSLMAAPFEAFQDGRNYAQLNQYQLKNDASGFLCNGTTLTPEAWPVLCRVVEIVGAFNYDESDPQTDYYSVNFHFEIGIGRWNKNFEVKGGAK